MEPGRAGLGDRRPLRQRPDPFNEDSGVNGRPEHHPSRWLPRRVSLRSSKRPLPRACRHRSSGGPPAPPTRWVLVAGRLDANTTRSSDESTSDVGNRPGVGLAWVSNHVAVHMFTLDVLDLL